MYRRRRTDRPLISVTALAALLVLLLRLVGAASASADPGVRGGSTAPVIVGTDDGAVRGTLTAENRTFLGIPYAAPPTGNLRWRPPAPAALWGGIRDATLPGNKCAQVEELSGGAVEGSEDCLNLNVYEPYPLPTTPMPVMVYIPGGGYVSGSNTDVDPSLLAEDQQMIVVTINYRLGAFGYLSTPVLTAEEPAGSGDFGVMDQQAALRWVQANIAAFGGNPARTTIAGQSAGGASVLAQVVSPAAAGLFRGAIVESGAGIGFTTRTAADAQGATFSAAVGCTDPATQLSCLRGLSTTTIVANELAGAPRMLLADNIAWAPTVGSNVLPTAPPTAFADGVYNKVPILQGTNHDEWRLFAGISLLQGQPALTPASYAGLMGQLFGAHAAEVLAQYPATAYNSPEAAYSAVATDLGLACPARTGDVATAATVPTYAYEFNDPNAPAPFTVPGFPLGAYHTAELQYVFPAAGYPGLAPAQVTLSQELQRYWGNFVARSTPDGPGVPAWAPYSATADLLQSLTPAATAPTGGFSVDHHCAFWAALAS